VVELGWVSAAQVAAARRARRRQLPVEEILVEKGLLARERLAEAREAVRQKPGVRLGPHLVETGAVPEQAWLEAYAEKHELAFVDLDFSLVDPEVLKKASLPYLNRHRLVPLAVENARLKVAVDDPEKAPLCADLSRLYGCPATMVLATRASVDETLAALSRPEEERLAPTAGPIQYHRLAESPDGNRVVDIVDGLLLRAMREGASDVHVEPMASKVRVRFRIDGSLTQVAEYPLGYAQRLVSRLKVLAQADVAQHRIHQDGRIYVRSGEQEVDIRASFYVTVFGENAVLRILRKAQTRIGLEEMGFAPAMLRIFVDDVLEPSSGLVLVTGPTGSGKTSTLYAAVAHLNDESKKIITCEEPVEYVIEGLAQCSVANRPGINFVDSLKAIVRQDPDVILIGEIRDRDSAEMAIQSALTGHKVLSTFHTEDSVGALLRLVDMQIEGFLIASTVTAILAQRLVRRQCPACQAEYVPTPRELRALSLAREELANVRLTRGAGCSACLGTGFRGRLGLFELLVMTDPLRDAILQRRPSHELRRLALAAPGFLHLQEDGIVKAVRGVTTFAEVLENAPRVQDVRPLGQLREMYEHG
jgi:type IV pilus assembly protein PilB